MTLLIKKVRYYSSKESVAKVNELGRITVVSPGTT
ncbi:Ig-like domain-containing protein [Acetivibrio clariflavus]